MPFHSLAGIPDGIGRTGTEGVLVAGMGVRVGVLVGSGVIVEVLVEVGRLVLVGVGVAVGLGAKVLQDAKEMDMTKSSIALPVIFIFPRFFVRLSNGLLEDILLPNQGSLPALNHRVGET